MKIKEIPEHFLAAGLLMLIITALGIVGEMDYQDALAAEAATNARFDNNNR